MNSLTLFSRISAEWKTKLFMGGLIACAFWSGYFLLQRYPVYPVAVMPVTIIDRFMPFIPSAAPVYLSQFVTMVILAWVTTTRVELAAFSKGLALIIAISFTVFFFYPTSVIRPDSVPGQNPLYDLVIRFDNPRNAFPSLHAAFGIFLAAYAPHVFHGWNTKNIQVGITWLCTAAVLISTLLTKQHAFLDILVGSFVGGAGYLVYAKTVAQP
jgi:membrane-associated phospholipid phosphatase